MRTRDIAAYGRDQSFRTTRSTQPFAGRDHHRVQSSLRRLSTHGRHGGAHMAQRAHAGGAIWRHPGQCTARGRDRPARNRRTDAAPGSAAFCYNGARGRQIRCDQLQHQRAGARARLLSELARRRTEPHQRFRRQSRPGLGRSYAGRHRLPEARGGDCRAADTVRSRPDVVGRCEPPQRGRAFRSIAPPLQARRPHGGNPAANCVPDDECAVLPAANRARRTATAGYGNGRRSSRSPTVARRRIDAERHAMPAPFPRRVRHARRVSDPVLHHERRSAVRRRQSRSCAIPRPVAAGGHCCVDAELSRP